MLGYISGIIPAQADADDIMFRSKVIITELLTNGIKHAGNGHTFFDIETNPGSVVIRKTDNGRPLHLINSHQHSAGQHIDNKKLISADILNSLYAIWEDDNHIRFASEEASFDDFLPVEQVMEHFGMLIITRSSDEFTYTYDKDTHSNIFRVRILF
jgi:anti-sigma regulatory factor (Ser/Thr protein kinase)